MVFLLGGETHIKTWYIDYAASDGILKMPLPYGTKSFLIIINGPADCCVAICTSGTMGAANHILKIANNSGADVRYSSAPEGAYGIYDQDGYWYYILTLSNARIRYNFTAIYI